MGIVKVVLQAAVVALVAYAFYGSLEHGVSSVHVMFAHKAMVKSVRAAGIVARWMGAPPSPSFELRLVRWLLARTARKTPSGCARRGVFADGDLAKLRARHLPSFLLGTYPPERSRTVDDGSVWFYGNSSATDAALVYFHGGGGVYGTPRDFAGLCWTLSTRTYLPVLALRYPLAPEHPAPTAGLWTASYIVQVAHRFERFAFVSTGGGSYPLLQALAVLRNIESPVFARIRGAALSSPQVLERVVMEQLSGAPVGSCLRVCQELPANATVPVDVHTPRLIACTSAANFPDSNVTVLRSDLTDMPPLLFQYSDGELLAGHAEEGCRRAGRSCELHRIAHATHAAINYHDYYPEAADALAHVVAFVRRVLPANETDARVADNNK